MRDGEKKGRQWIYGSKLNDFQPLDHLYHFHFFMPYIKPEFIWSVTDDIYVWTTPFTDIYILFCARLKTEIHLLFDVSINFFKKFAIEICETNRTSSNTWNTDKEIERMKIVVSVHSITSSDCISMRKKTDSKEPEN